MRREVLGDEIYPEWRPSASRPPGEKGTCAPKHKSNSFLGCYRTLAMAVIEKVHEDIRRFGDDSVKKDSAMNLSRYNLFCDADAFVRGGWFALLCDLADRPELVLYLRGIADEKRAIAEELRERADAERHMKRRTARLEFIARKKLNKEK